MFAWPPAPLDCGLAEMDTIVLTCLAVVLGAGLCAVGWSLLGVRLFPGTQQAITNVIARSHNLALWVTGALAVALVVQLVTGWVVAAIWVFAGICSIPLTRRTDTSPDVEIDRVEAIATWADQVRDTLAASAGIQQALIATAQRPPQAIQAELTRFSFYAGRDLPAALRRLGADLAHPAADMVIAGLLAAIELDAGRVGDLLMRLTESIRAEASMRVRVEVSRSRIRTSWRIVAAAISATMMVIIAFGRGLTSAYSSLAGQLWLALVGLVVVVSIVTSKRLARIPQPARFVSRERLEALT